MKCISFNINSVRARPHQLIHLRDNLDPDVDDNSSSSVLGNTEKFGNTARCQALNEHSHDDGQKYQGFNGISPVDSPLREQDSKQ